MKKTIVAIFAAFISSGAFAQNITATDIFKGVLGAINAAAAGAATQNAAPGEERPPVLPKSLPVEPATKERQAEKEPKISPEKQAEKTKTEDLRAGKVAPNGFVESTIAFGSEHGGALASAPKIRADNGLYHMHGKISIANETKPQFIAAISSSQGNEMLANALRQSRGLGESTDYFYVLIPKSLQKKYYDSAKVNGGFDFIGRYVSNTKYSTVAGQEKSAPVFEAVFFEMWK